MVAIFASTDSATRPSGVELPQLPLVIAGAPDAWSDTLRQAGVPVENYDPARVQGRFVLYDRRRGACPPLADGQEAIELSGLIEDANDILDSLSDEHATRHAWRVGELTVSEIVARVEKRPLRRRLLDALRQEIERRDGIWLAVSPVPWPYRTWFNLRADHDAYVPADFTSFLHAIAGHESSVSHFVCASGFTDHRDALRQLADHDVGSHGFWHHTYRDAASNRHNIQRGIEALQGAGIDPSGFVAPHGRFHAELRTVLDELSISHSGEFSFDYNDWPNYPTGSRVLQIPVHPICLGIALETLEQQGQTDEPSQVTAADWVTDHLCHWAVRQQAAAEPIVVYGHPDGRLGRYPRLVTRLLRTIDNLPGVWQTTQTAIARWWRERERISIWANREQGRIVIECDGLPAGITPAVDIWRGERVARAPLNERRQMLELDALEFERRPVPPQLDATELGEPTTIRHCVKRWLDWEKVTPTDEIDSSTWRGWLKRSIRSIRD